MSNDTQTPIAPISKHAGPLPPAGLMPPRAGEGPGGLKRIFGFLKWVGTGFGIIPALFYSKVGRFKNQEIIVYSVHRAFFLWALVLVGFVGAWITRQWPGSSLAMGWIYVWVLLYTFITILFDVGSLLLLLWAGIITFVWLASHHIEMVRHIRVLSGVTAYMRALHPGFPRGFAIVTSWLLLGPWIGALFISFTNGRKRFTPNEISEWHVGDGSEMTDRSGLKFRTRYRDVLESILGFGCGDLIAYDNSHNIIKRYENVLGLVFLWNRLDAILHERTAIVDNAAEDPVEVEETRHVARVETQAKV